MSSRKHEKHERRDLFPKILAERREALGWTQKQLADALGIKESAVTHWESGRTRPRGPRMKRLAKLIALPVDELSGTRPLSPESMVPLKIDIPALTKQLEDVVVSVQGALATLQQLPSVGRRRDSKAKRGKATKGKTKRKP